MKNLTKLLSLSVFVSENTFSDVFFSYAAHVGTVEIQINKNGWKKSTDEYHTDPENITAYIDDSEAIKNILDKLKELI